VQSKENYVLFQNMSNSWFTPEIHIGMVLIPNDPRTTSHLSGGSVSSILCCSVFLYYKKKVWLPTTPTSLLSSNSVLLPVYCNFVLCKLNPYSQHIFSYKCIYY
jgi:hypothetical protein